MARWDDSTNDEMDELLKRFGNTAVANFRVEANRWADTIGRRREKLFDITPLHAIRVTAENHCITRVEVAA